MKKATIYIDEIQAQLLDLLALMDRRPTEDLVREALREYLKRRDLSPEKRIGEPRQDVPDEEWGARWDAALERFRASLDPNWSAEEREADIAAALGEVRKERLARRSVRDR